MSALLHVNNHKCATSFVHPDKTIMFYRKFKVNIPSKDRYRNLFGILALFDLTIVQGAFQEVDSA